MIKKDHLVTDKKRITYFFFLTIILVVLNTQIILGATNTTVPLPPFPTNPQTTTNTDISNVIIQENIKTRMEIKQYCDQKIASMIDTVKTEGASIIGQNFAEMDRRVHELATTIFIKFVIATFTTILLAQLVFYILKRRVEKKHMPRAMNFKEIPISPTQAGIIVEEKQPELTPPIPTFTTTPSPTTSPITPENPPTTPSIPSIPNPLPSPPMRQVSELPVFPELQQPILLSPKERERIIREQEEVNKKRRKEAEKQMAKLIDEHNKNRKETTKIKKKLSKPEETKKILDEEHEELQKEIDRISKEYQLPV